METTPNHRPPVIRRGRQQKKDLAKLTKIFEEFHENQLKHLKIMLRNGENFFQATGPELLDLRRKLVSYIEKGMHERKDCEIEIAVCAGIIWFNRLDYEHQVKILEEWG
jgi:uncharacterized Fe-S cluster-containing radical SAM superfamily protein